MTTFRLAAHRRLVTDPRRGRLLLQLAYVADRDADPLWDRYAWPPVQLDEIHEATRANVEHLRAMEDALAAEAARLGVTGGIREAFRDVFAAADVLCAAGREREELTLRVEMALNAGAILTAGDVEVAPIGEGRHGALAACRRGEWLLNEDRLDAWSAAAAFVGERGAGEAAARAALEAWESKKGRAG